MACASVHGDDLPTHPATGGQVGQQHKPAVISLYFSLHMGGCGGGVYRRLHATWVVPPNGGSQDFWAAQTLQRLCGRRVVERHVEHDDL